MASEQFGTFKLGIEIEENSIDNDINLSSFTIEATVEGIRTYERDRLNIPDELLSAEFHKDVNLDFYETISLPTLQQMASFVVAIESWRQITRSENAKLAAYSFPTDDFLNKEYKDVEELLQNLPVPI
ncbi:hypothetical protein U1Q18_044682 [Sarracenia purpurea var. burkii]